MDLLSIHIIEKDINNDIFVSWSFPSAQIKQVICDRSGLDHMEVSSTFSKFKNIWLYHITLHINNAKHSKVKAVSICVCSKKFNPKKYNDFLIPLMKTYSNTFDPVSVLEAYLSVVTSGKLNSQYGIFDQSKYDDRRAFIVSLKPLFELFGVETIIIWMAVLLKKRIFVYSDRIDDLLKYVRMLPLIGSWHRMDWSIIRPVTNITAMELSDLKVAGVYIAGFNDKACASHTDMYDIFVDISYGRITIADQSRAAFTFAKFHKDLAQKFLKASQTENDQALIKFIAVKTKELIDNLKTLKNEEDGKVSLDSLREQNLPANMDTFLFNVALAEKLT